MADESKERTSRKKWWYSIVLFGIICIFLLGLDILTTFQSTGKIAVTWSVWPIAAILFFGVALSLLNRFGTE